MKKLLAVLMTMMMFMVAVPLMGLAEEDEIPIPDISFRISDESIAEWGGALVTELKTDGESPDGTDYLTLEKRKVLVSTTDFIPMQAEPLVLELFYKSDTASAAAIYIQYYNAENANVGQSAFTSSDASGNWMKHSVTIAKEGAASFKIWLRNLNDAATVSYASPKLRLQSEGNAFLNGDMQEYTEENAGVKPGSWKLTSGTTGGTIGGVREANGNVYVSMNAVGAYGTYLQQKVAVTEGSAYRLSFKIRGNLTAPAVQVYMYKDSTSVKNAFVPVTAVGTPSQTQWTEYEVYITMQTDTSTVDELSVFLRNPVEDYSADFDDVSLTLVKTNFTLLEEGGSVTAKGHMVLPAAVTNDKVPSMIVCVYKNESLSYIDIIPGTKADCALSANGQFAAESEAFSVTAGDTVKVFAWENISSLNAIGKVKKMEVK